MLNILELDSTPNRPIEDSLTVYNEHLQYWNINNMTSMIVILEYQSDCDDVKIRELRIWEIMYTIGSIGWH